MKDNFTCNEESRSKRKYGTDTSQTGLDQRFYVFRLRRFSVKGKIWKISVTKQATPN